MRRGEFMVDPYLDWSRKPGVPSTRVSASFSSASRIRAKVDVDIKKGGNPIEYKDRDPRIHRMLVDGLARKGLAANMPQFE